jgi:membrane fusion protein (multidrug efflux system)
VIGQVRQLVNFTTLGMKISQFFRVLVGSAIVLAATAGIGWGLLAYKSRQADQVKNKPAPPEVVESVRIEPVRESEFQQFTTSIGTVVAPQWMTVRTEASGRISALHVRSGQSIQQGDLLLELDSSVEIASKKAAQAKLNMATRSLKRLTGLSESGAASSAELEQSQFDKESAEAEIERLDAVIAKRSLRAPYDARVGLINVSVGQYLPEGVELTTLTGRGDRFYVDFAIPQSISSFIQISQGVTVQVQGKPIAGTVIAVDARSDRLTRNLMVRAECKAPDGPPSPNDSVNVFVEYGPKNKAIVIPASAVLRSPEGSYVYIAITDEKGVDRATPRPVKTLQNLDNLVVIQEGVALGERVISQGSFKLRPGLAVRDVRPVSDKSGS